MLYFQVNSQHWINAAYITRIQVHGSEAHAAIHIYVLGDIDPQGIIYKQFHKGKVTGDGALLKAERELQKVIDAIAPEKVRNTTGFPPFGWAAGKA